MTNRREFIKSLMIGGGIAAVGPSMGSLLGTRSAVAATGVLPTPVVNNWSYEAVVNSRHSYHAPNTGEPMDPQVMANVLWATAQAPVAGSFMTIYVTTADGVYIYDPASRALSLHRSGDYRSEQTHDFEVGIAGELVEDVGAALHYGHLATQSFWVDKPMPPYPACCTKETATIVANEAWQPQSEILMVNCYSNGFFNNGVDTALAAVSSDGSLPSPVTDGGTPLENVIANLNVCDQFSSQALTPEAISQILFASYGCTPHNAEGEIAGLSAASAHSLYFLTDRIYVLQQGGMGQYHNRLPAGDNTTRDHRLASLTDEDIRADLKAVLPALPDAPAHFAFCVDEFEDDRITTVEAGFCGAAALAQATSMGLCGAITTGLTEEEKAAVQDALMLPTDHIPSVIFSMGHAEGGGDVDAGPDTDDTDPPDPDDGGPGPWDPGDQCQCNTVGYKRSDFNKLLKLLFR